ncbi:MAG: glycerol kinase [Halothiobacillus sp. 14-56-357]|jgi:glycerol kinase|uniref:glycerol kinase GlpK n=1 Tax=Halothiobacillus sp. 15-55-196 TaxID=1970382 RepID=UPI000BC62740|nr:glycerol kinase GlpK [Halothiobacillus sp. 15-55-196]OZB37280.1 MAG: glycerol kinase [Halothiobacillus sp. 15-55-196]OZB56485.1 MAG: glycerol kinase [Halothiobacillus sp. 14-56-357]OZB78433.1 MAG: glycerol kinase [Halothiobacillus sp. 13-55-115]
MSQYIGAIDLGTTSSRFIVFDRAGQIVSMAQKEHRQIYPKPDWVEHDPIEILHNVNEVTGAALAKEGLNTGDLAAIGITNQRETTVLWDKATGKPLHNALVWMDTRTDALVSSFAKSGGKDRFRAKTGLPLTTYFSGLKLRWLLDQLPEARIRAENGDILFGTMDSWLIWHLTGGARGGRHITDVTNASRTQLMNLATCQWDEDILEAFAIPKACLPRIVSSSQIHGEVTTVPLRGAPIAGILGDQQAALVGQTCFVPGEAKNTYGTGSFLLMNTGSKIVPSQAGLLTTVAYQFGDEAPCYALEGSIAMTGALVQWLRDNLNLIEKSADIEPLAASVENNGGVYIVPAFSGLYAPYWKDDARGVIVGLTRYANRAHIARAALESAAFQVRDVVEAMQTDSGIELKTLSVDGGMVCNNLLMQFQSDMLAAPVVRPKITETTALGAAYAAGLAVGYWKNTDDLRANWSADHSWTPLMPDEQRETYYRYWKRAVTRSFDWVEDKHET